MKWIPLIAYLIAAFSTSTSCASAELESPTSERTDREIFESCRLCHGTREMQRGPILDGLPAWYVAHQLQKFRQGILGSNSENRSAALMASGMSLLRDDDEIARVSEFIGTLPPQNHIKTIRGDAERGKLLYLTCAPCHGSEGRGNQELKAPPLNVQEDWYLFEQSWKFKAGQRGSDPRDAEGKLMQLSVTNLVTKDFRDVVRYIAQELTLATPVPSPRTNALSR